MQNPRCLDRMLTNLENDSKNSTHKNAATTFIEHLSGNSRPASGIQRAAFLRIAAVDPALINTSGRDAAQINRIVDGICDQLKIQRYAFERGAREARTKVDKRRKQTIDLLIELAGIVGDARDTIGECTQSYQGINTISTFQTRLGRALSKEDVKASVVPFLGFEREALNESINLTKEYVSRTQQAADTEHVRSAFSSADQMLQAVLAAYDNAPTEFGSEIAATFRKISTDLDEHFSESPFGKPASIVLRAHHRRYPLHMPNLDISIPVELHNDGAGVATHVQLELNRHEDSPGSVRVGPPVRLSAVTPNSKLTIEMRAKTEENPDEAHYVLNCTWVDAVSTGDTDSTNSVAITLKPQDTTVNWDEIQWHDPYSRDAVTRGSDLIGRSPTVREIVSTLNTAPVGSVYIHGQKRVGKTSIANVALEQMSTDAICVSISIGEINHHDADIAVDNLGDLIMDRVVEEIPELGTEREKIRLQGSISPVTRLLRKAAERMRVVIMFDEFDQLPIELLVQGDRGRVFFLALRTIAQIRGIGVLLVAGERMKLILNQHGQHLNLLKPCPVDYFNRDQWTDFEDLVRKPTEYCLEFGADAYASIYEYTEGNPYYTKLICAGILARACERHDSFVGAQEVELAVETLIERGGMDSASFSHYWDDLILEGGIERNDEIVLDRKRALLAFGLSNTPDQWASMDSVVREAREMGLDEGRTRGVLAEFDDRSFFVIDGNRVRSRIGLFGRWIAGAGQGQLMLTAHELRNAEKAIDSRKKYQVSYSEAKELVDGWSIYKTSAVSVERVLEYLGQFGEVYNQRLIFRLLQKLFFVGPAEERKLLRDAYRLFQAEMVGRHGRWNETQVRISYTGGAGQSGAQLARTFAMEVGLYRKGLVKAPGELRREAEGVSDIVLVDDFVGSGESLSVGLRRFRECVAEGQVVHLYVVAGMTDGVARVSDTAEEVFGGEGARVTCIHPLRSGRPEDIIADVFENDSEGTDAYHLILSYGERLEKRSPLGYGKCCSLITFSGNIPNNAPPVLWRRSTAEDFRFEPLFLRE